MSVPPTSSASLSEHLHEVTEGLAAAQTPAAVFDVVLAPLLEALNATAGTVLLVNASGDRLEQAARRGDLSGAQPLWQDGPLAAGGPAGDALRQQEPLFFEQPGDLVKAYPELASRTGGVAAVATAVLPMVLDDRPLGALILDFEEPREFTAEEVRFLRTLANQSAIALGRARLLSSLRQQIEERTQHLLTTTRAQDAFVAFAEAVGTESEVLTLAQQAVVVLQANLPGLSVAYYEREQDRWVARAWSDNIPAEVIVQLRRGVSVAAPDFAQALQSGAPVFAEHWDAPGNDLSEATMYGAAGFVPLPVGGHTRSLLAVGKRITVHWSERERSVVRAVGQSLTLALERAEAARQLQAQTEEAERRSQVLEAFAALTAELGVRQRPYELIQRTQEIVLSLLSEGHALYWEPVEGFWRCQAQTGDVGHSALQQVINAGWPVGQLPTLDRSWQTREPEYQDQYTLGTDLSPELTGHIQSVAVLPIFQGSTLRGVMNFTLHHPHVWQAVDRVMLETVQQSLSLALDRLALTEGLQRQRDEAERRVQALEAFAVLSRDLAGETNRYALVRRAQEIMLSLLTPGYALYWEAGEDRWQLKSQVGDIGDPALQQFVDEYGLPLDAPALHSTWLTGVPNYQDNYAQGADTPAEMIRHVNAATSFQVRVQGEAIGMLAIGLFDQRVWTPMDRAVLETAIYSLGLLLERAQSVEALAHTNQELQLSNQELEAFTYSASHDLRTPVRHVKGFTEMAGRALDQGDLVKARRHHQIVSDAADRMTDLIDAMLVLSRAGRAPVQVRGFALGELVAQAQRDAQLEFPDQRVTWQVGMLPGVQADPQLLQQVLTNLLSNAVKYAQGRDPLVVKIWAEEHPGEVCVFVQDNGVGFNPEYADKLFGVFQRLHRQEEFQGTGVGLATVRRLILRHGGRVWAEGRLGEGSTFGFSLPQ